MASRPSSAFETTLKKLNVRLKKPCEQVLTLRHVHIFVWSYFFPFCMLEELVDVPHSPSTYDVLVLALILKTKPRTRNNTNVTSIASFPSYIFLDKKAPISISVCREDTN